PPFAVPPRTASCDSNVAMPGPGAEPPGKTTASGPLPAGSLCWCRKFLPFARRCMMRGRLLVVALAGSLVAAASPCTDRAKVGWRVRPDSKWIAVWGRKGEAKIEKASVTFKGRQLVEISWNAKTGPGSSCSETICYYYQHDAEACIGKINLW